VLLAAVHPLTFFRAIVLGLIQGVTELFPISSLGHTVLLPTLFGWHDLVKAQSQRNSFYLVFVVGLHCASALALLVFYWKDWVRIIGAFFRTLRTRKIETSEERLAWLIIVATIPAGIVGVLLATPLQDLFSKPLAAAIFLTLNGFVLLGGERLRSRSQVRALAARQGVTPEGGRRLDTLAFPEAGVIGLGQVLALLAGFSRSGVTMVAGLLRGLDHEDAVKFAFLLATPVILAAGLYKLPELFGHLGNGIRGQVLAGSVVAAVASYGSARFLTRYFKTRTLTPFGIYCIAAGVFFIILTLV